MARPSKKTTEDKCASCRACCAATRPLWRRAAATAAVALWFAGRSRFEHVRARYRSPNTNGVIERWCQSITYEWPYRHDIDAAADPGAPVVNFIDEHNTIRAHESIGYGRPIDHYLATPITEAVPGSALA